MTLGPHGYTQPVVYNPPTTCQECVMLLYIYKETISLILNFVSFIFVLTCVYLCAYIHTHTCRSPLAWTCCMCECVCVIFANNIVLGWESCMEGGGVVQGKWLTLQNR